MGSLQPKRDARRSLPIIKKPIAKDCDDKKVLSDIALLTTLDPSGGEKVKTGLLGREEWCDIQPEYQPWRLASYTGIRNKDPSRYYERDLCFHYGSHRPWPNHKQDLELYMLKKNAKASQVFKKPEVFPDKEYRINVPPSGFVTFHVLELFNLKIFAERMNMK